MIQNQPPRAFDPPLNTPRAPAAGDLAWLGWVWRKYLTSPTGGLAITFLIMMIKGGILDALSYRLEPLFDPALLAGGDTIALPLYAGAPPW